MDRNRRECKWIGYLVALALSVVAQSSSAQLLTENFDYGGAGGDLTTVSGGNWINFFGSTPTAGYQGTSLSMPDYSPSGIGGSALFTASGEWVFRGFAAQNTGPIYLSALVTITSATPSGSFLLMFKDGGNNLRARLFARDSSGDLQFGLTTAVSAGVYSSTAFSFGTTYLVVLRYDIDTGDSALHVLASVPAVEPGVPLLTAAGTATIGQQAVAIRQGSNGPTGVVDGIQVGTSWGTSVPVELLRFSID